MVPSVMKSFWNTVPNIFRSCSGSMERMAPILMTSLTTVLGLVPIIAAGDKMRSYMSINCTGCGYCDVCPKGIAIPDIFAMFNRAQRDGDGVRSMNEYRALEDRNQSGCVECGACAAACPQHIDIPEELKKIHKRWGAK